MEKVKIAKKAPAPKKEEIFAGVLVEVRTEGTLSNGLLWWDKGSGLNTNYNTKKKQTMEVFFPSSPTRKFDVFAQYERISYVPGSKFEVVVGPAKRAESHTVVVKDIISGKEGFVHWSEFKACCIVTNAVMLNNIVQAPKFK